MIFLANLSDIYSRFGKRHFEIFHRSHDDVRDGKIAEPLVIGGNHKPGRFIGGAAIDRVFISRLVFFPVFSFQIISLADFPLSGRVFEPLLETL